MSELITPHGGMLVDLFLSEDQVKEEKRKAVEYPSWDLTQRQRCDLELLLNGGFSPLCGFLGQQDYQAVLANSRLANGVLWPIPIMLDLPESTVEQLSVGSPLALRDPEGVILAVMTVEEIWQPDKTLEAKAVYGTTDTTHAGVNALFNHTHPYYVSGKLQGLDATTHYDFKYLRHSPAEMRERFEKWGWQRVVGFQTRNPMHRAHYELTLRAAQDAEANLLLHPAVGMTKPGDVNHFSRVRCYEHVVKRYPEQTSALSLLPLAMRMAGPREALWHAIIRKNYGCSHFIVGRDHAGPGKDKDGKPFYGDYDAQALLAQYAEELGIAILAYPEMVYVQDRAEYVPAPSVKAGENVMAISGTEFRRRLQKGLEVPEWFSFTEVMTELRRAYPPRHKQGFTVFCTGLSGAGKSTIANALMVKLMELGGRSVTLLDGDVVRKHLSSELGFSREHRDLNILRIGYVASEITKNGGIAICAPIAPYRATRQAVREMVSDCGGFVEVYVATSLEVCESRDRKGLYAKARAGVISEFTGISDPYETPENPEITVDTSDCTPDEAAHRLLLKLEALGYIR